MSSDQTFCVVHVLSAGVCWEHHWDEGQTMKVEVEDKDWWLEAGTCRIVHNF